MTVLPTTPVRSQAGAFRIAAQNFKAPAQRFLKGRKGFRVKSAKEQLPHVFETWTLGYLAFDCNPTLYH